MWCCFHCILANKVILIWPTSLFNPVLKLILNVRPFKTATRRFCSCGLTRRIRIRRSRDFRNPPDSSLNHPPSSWWWSFSRTSMNPFLTAPDSNWSEIYKLSRKVVPFIKQLILPLLVKWSSFLVQVVLNYWNETQIYRQESANEPIRQAKRLRDFLHLNMVKVSTLWKS